MRLMELIYLFTFLLACVSSFVSGMAGGGGGYIMAPYWLFAGMTPAQGAATGAFMAIGMSASSLAAFRKGDYMPKRGRLTIILSLFTALAALIGALILTRIDPQSFKVILAIITLLSIPMLCVDRRAIRLGARLRGVGVALFLLVLMVSSVITSSAFSLIISIGLSQLFQLTLLESTALRRVIGLVQSSVIWVVLALQGNVLLLHSVVGCAGGMLGSYIGTRCAISGGEVFAKYALAAGAFVGAVMLLV